MDEYTQLAAQIAELRAQLNNGVKSRLARIESAVDRISAQLTDLRIMMGEFQTQLEITNGRSKANTEKITKLGEKTLIVSVKNAVLFSVFMTSIGALLALILKRIF